MRRFALVFVMAFGLSGCVSTSVVPDWLGWIPGSTTKAELCADEPADSRCGEIQPATLFFAGVADYTRAKSAAVTYAESAVADPTIVAEMVRIAEQADEEIAAVVADFSAGTATENQYLRAARVVRSLVIRLNAKVAQGKVAR